MSITILNKRTKFTELSDVPHSYTGSAGKSLVVKATEDGLEFGGGGGGFAAPPDILFETFSITSITYDTYGNITEIIAATGHKATFTYNTSNKLIEEKYYNQDGTSLLLTISYTYDTNGNLETITRVEV